jgi:ubiquinone/menaquinone biosynthesis C-methylase UbiE
MDPLAGSAWSTPSTVAGFAASAANATLMAYAEARLAGSSMRAVDIGCGAARNAIPLAEAGWHVTGLDLSWPMLEAAARRAHQSGASGRTRFALATMDELPVATASADLIVAHGIWNLARSGAEFRRAVGEAARIARPGAGLFVFTFSRRTLTADARPVDGESFVFTEFSGQPQVFPTADQLFDELAAAGFAPDPAVLLTEHNVPRPGALATRGVPVIYEAAFRSVGVRPA